MNKSQKDVTIEDKYLNADFDYKIILLGENYEKDNPIKNILKSKDNNYYKDDVKSDYYDKSNIRGHIENYKVINEIYKIICPGWELDNKDVMNSFWTTYKFFLQMEYPDYFKPIGKLNDNIPLKKLDKKELHTPERGYPPYTSGRYEKIDRKYIFYYKEEFDNIIIESDCTWTSFLLSNFDKFPKVHNNWELKEFAKLTHTIGNICIVPENFNTDRGSYDYWDYALNKIDKYLKFFEVMLEKKNKSYFNQFIDINLLRDDSDTGLTGFVDVNYIVKELWKGHFSDGLIPKTKEEIEQFLKNVNKIIISRGEKIIEKVDAKIKV